MINKLEYRISDEEKGYPALCHFKYLPQEEILARRDANYFTYEKTVYEQVGTSLEGDCFVFYLQEYEGESVFPDALKYNSLFVEIRLGKKKIEERTLIHTYECQSHSEVMVYTGNMYIYIAKEEYIRTALEFDQDRKTFVLYVRPTGFSFN